MIIIVAGFRGSGKSLFGEVAKKMNFAVFEMSGPILSLMEELGMETTNESVRNFATDFREKGGTDAVARLLLPKLKLALQESRKIVIIGARSVEEIDALKQLGGVLTVALLSDEKKRFARVGARGKPSDPKKISDFRWADEVEAKWGLKKLLDSCDVKMENNSSEAQFREKVKKLLKTQGFSKRRPSSQTSRIPSVCDRWSHKKAKAESVRTFRQSSEIREHSSRCQKPHQVAGLKPAVFDNAKVLKKYGK